MKHFKNASIVLLFTILLIQLNYVNHVNQFIGDVQEIHPFAKKVYGELKWHEKYYSNYTGYLVPKIEPQYLYLLGMLHDGHTSLDIFNESYDTPNFKISCYHNQIYILDPGDYKSVEFGDQIISINEESVNSIINRFSNLVSYDNHSLLDLRVSQLLFTRKYFDYLGLEDNNCWIQVKTEDGKYVEEVIQFDVKHLLISDYSFENKLLEFKDYSVLKLNDLSYSNKNYDLLKQAFAETEPEILFLDLSECPGGGSEFTTMLMSMLPVDQYEFLDGTVRSNNRIAACEYKKDIYVIVSNQTYSAAALLAAVLSENKVAYTIGDMMGMNRHSTGNTKLLDLFNINNKALVATSEFIVPSRSEKLIPEILLEEYIEDYKGLAMMKSVEENYYETLYTLLIEMGKIES